MSPAVWVFGFSFSFDFQLARFYFLCVCIYVSVDMSVKEETLKHLHVVHKEEWKTKKDFFSVLFCLFAAITYENCKYIRGRLFVFLFFN